MTATPSWNRRALRLRRVVCGLGLILLALPLRTEETPSLTLEKIFSEDGLLGPMPTGLQWSPDGKQLTYLLKRPGGEGRDLWVFDLKTRQKQVLVSAELLEKLAPPAEKAAEDERDKERLLRYSVAAYRWSPDSRSILFTSAGQLYLFDLDNQRAKLLAKGKSGIRDAKFCPNGRWVSFLHEHDIWLVPPSGGEERRLTYGGTGELLHGDLDWVYPEEFRVRTGYRWSPDGRRLAFYEIDQSGVGRHPIADLTKLPATFELQRYPKAGTENPRVRIGIVEAKPGRKQPQTVWVESQAEYLPRFRWVDTDWLAAQEMNRAQDQLKLFYTDATDGRRRDVRTEKDSFWINLSDDWRFLADGKHFLWTSETTGFRHIYVYGQDGRQRRALTRGEWEVKSIAGVDEEKGWVYYTSNEDNELGSALYRIKLDGTDKERLTPAEGTATAVMNKAATAYAVTWSSMTRTPRVEISEIDGESTEIHAAPTLEEYDLIPPRLHRLETEDGALVRFLFLDPDREQFPGKRPVLIYVYGGPRAPTIRDRFGGGRGRYLFHQYLAKKGYLVVQFDDRASALLGHKHETALSRKYGLTAVKDYRTAVDYLASLGNVDTDRIAIWGWSGGGFSTLLALTRTELFRAGISVAPVTDWKLYDSIYTERYMGLPQNEAEAYQANSPVTGAENLHGRLLLVHGTSDDNVHYQNAVQFIDALVEAGKPYELLLYPGKTHSIHGSKTRLHLFRSIEDFLERHLQWPAHKSPFAHSTSWSAR